MRLLLLLLFLIINASAFCQDSIKTVFTEEHDSLSPVRFIDRYENIFMTKVPTRHMFKISISQYIQSVPFALYNDKGFKNSALQLGYEYKLSPAYSVAVSGQMPLVGNAIPISWISDNISIGSQLRWYYDMKKRIQAGKSANNFTGNYFALEYSYLGARSRGSAVGLRMGFQRRFLNHGFIDFNIGLRKNVSLSHLSSSEWGIFTEVNLGLALGDWKRTSKPLLCELIRCDEQINQHWKIKIPDIKFGSVQKTLGLGVAYEVSLGKSPLSFNFQYDLSLQKAGNYLKGYFYTNSSSGYYFRETRSKEISQSFSIQPRYYVSQQALRRKGKGGTGLSGIYAGINLEYAKYHGQHIAESIYDSHIDVNTPEFKFRLENKSLHSGPMLGIQQRLFKNGYIDFNTSCNWDLKKTDTFRLIRIRANLTVGLAFGS